MEHRAELAYEERDSARAEAAGLRLELASSLEDAAGSALVGERDRERLAADLAESRVRTEAWEAGSRSLLREVRRVGAELVEAETGREPAAAERDGGGEGLGEEARGERDDGEGVPDVTTYRPNGTKYRDGGEDLDFLKGRQAEGDVSVYGTKEGDSEGEGPLGLRTVDAALRSCLSHLRAQLTRSLAVANASADARDSLGFANHERGQAGGAVLKQAEGETRDAVRRALSAAASSRGAVGGKLVHAGEEEANGCQIEEGEREEEELRRHFLQPTGVSSSLPAMGAQDATTIGLQREKEAIRRFF